MNRILKHYFIMLKEAKIYHIVFACVYVLGIVLGVLFNTELNKLVLPERVVGFYQNAFSDSGSVVSLIIALVISDALFLLIFYAFSYSFYLAVLQLAFVLYRGYILGSVAFLFFGLFGISGAFLFIFCVFIHNVLVSAALSCYSGITANLMKRGRACIKTARRDLFIIASVIVSAALIIEIIMLLCILRPINYSF